MSLQFSTELRNAMLDQIETIVGESGKLLVYTGSAPAHCADAEGGTLLAQFDLAADWAAAASGGSKSFSGTPLQTVAVGSGNAAHFRLTESDGETCHKQGTVTLTGGGGDMTIDNTSIEAGQTVKVTGFTVTAPGA